ncbi:MAG TPA: flagellar basal body rod protein FlgB [Burkholderiaceae bacterium]
MIGKLDQYLRFHESALSIRAQRQQLLASNMANADTPNYKARDVDFNSALQGALSRGTQPQSPLATTSPKHLPGTPDADTGPGGAPLMYRGVVQGAVDGNTVDMDVERNQFADNAIRYEAGITMTNMLIKDMLASLQGGQ